MTNYVQRKAVGVKVIINVVNSAGEPVTLSGATNLEIKMRALISSKGITKTATLEGTNSLTCLTAEDDLDDIGAWMGQGYYEKDGFKGHTEPVEIFIVKDNLN